MSASEVASFYGLEKTGMSMQKLTNETWKREGGMEFWNLASNSFDLHKKSQEQYSHLFPYTYYMGHILPLCSSVAILWPNSWLKIADHACKFLIGRTRWHIWADSRHCWRTGQWGFGARNYSAVAPSTTLGGCHGHNSLRSL